MTFNLLVYRLCTLGGDSEQQFTGGKTQRLPYNHSVTHKRLIDWCLTARKHIKVNLCQLRGVKLAQAAKDGQ